MRRLSVLLTVLCLCMGLWACGGSVPEETQQPTEIQMPTETQEPTVVQETRDIPEDPDILYEKSGTLEDGTTFTTYRRGGPDGVKVKLIYDTPAGFHHEEYYDSAGVIEYSFTTKGDGSSYAIEYYPSGNMARSITTEPDGSYLEVHFLDNGYIDNNGMLTSGDGYFEKEVSADGLVTDRSHYRGKVEDATLWTTEQQEDGTVIRAHYRSDGRMIEVYGHNLDTGWHMAELYDANGNKTSTEVRYDRRREYSLAEYYEDGSIKHRLTVSEDGTEREETFTESGCCTYLRTAEAGETTEYFGDESGNLKSYVRNSITYEGDTIPGEAQQVWETVKNQPAENG